MIDKIIRSIILILTIFYLQQSYADSLPIIPDTLKRLNNQFIDKTYSDILRLSIDSNRIKLNKALALSKISGDTKTEVEVYIQLGDYYARNSVSDSLLKYYKKAFELGIQIDYPKCFTNLGYKISNTYWDIGNYSQALEMALQLKAYYENENTIEDQAHLTILLGIIYLKLQDYPAALENLQHSARISERIKNYGLLGVIYTNIGNLYLNTYKYVEALDYYEKGVKLEVDNKEYRSAGRSFESIAKVYLALENPAKVDRFLKKALEYNIASSDIVGQLRTYSTYGKYYNYLKKYNEAIEYLKEAEGFAIKADSKEYYMYTCEQLSIAYQNIYNYKNALYYKGKYLSLYKQIYNVQDFAKIKKLENELRVEKSNNELIKTKIEKQKYINILLIAVFLLSIAIGNLFMVMYFRSIRVKKSLMKMNVEIQSQKEYVERINIELEDAKKIAENSNQLKGHILSNISHEIRTPLNGIVGLSELIVTESTPSLVNQNYFEMIKKSSNRLLYTIDNIVELAHISTSQIQLTINAFDPKELVDEIYQFYAPMFESCENKISFKYIYESNNYGVIESDRVLLRKILVQLIDNAIKFTSEGQISFGYEVKDHIFRFIVKDTGVGISDSSKKIIFESFRQEQETFIREYEGVGIGLTIAKKLSELLGANLWFESKKGQGTTFFLSFNQVILKEVD